MRWGGSFPRASLGGVHIPRKRVRLGLAKPGVLCSAQAPRLPPSQLSTLALKVSGSRWEWVVGTACFACPCWVGCRLACVYVCVCGGGQPAGVPAPPIAWTVGAPLLAPYSCYLPSASALGELEAEA